MHGNPFPCAVTLNLAQHHCLCCKMTALISNEKKWTHEWKMLSITTRLRNEGDFSANKKKKNTLWEQVLREIKEVDSSFPFSRDEISRCFVNIMVTYKRIKKRKNTSGESATHWEFFDMIDEIFGSRSSINVPEEMVESSLTNLTEILLNDAPMSPNMDDILDRSCSSSVVSKKRKRNEVLDFLKEESEKDHEIAEKLIKQENERLEIEKAKLDELRKIRELFQMALQNQPNNK